MSHSKQHDVIPPARPPPPEIPKSPPKWPLRPGVMVHVKVNTKRNLCASRTQSPSALSYGTVSTKTPQSPTESTRTATTTICAASPQNTSYASPISAQNTSKGYTQLENNDSKCDKADNDTVAAVSLPVCDVPTVVNGNGIEIGPKLKSTPPAPPPRAAATVVLDKVSTSTSYAVQSSVDNDKALNERNVNDVTANSNPSDTVPVTDPNNTSNILNNEELINFTTSSLIERILGRLRWRRERSKNDCTNRRGLTKTNKRAVTLLRRSARWFGSGKSTNSSTGLFDRQHHHLTGITCTDGGNCFFSSSIFT